MCDSVNQSRFPKEGNLPELARLGQQSYEGWSYRVYLNIHTPTHTHNNCNGNEIT